MDMEKIDALAAQLEELLKTEEKELTEGYGDNPKNWQASKARTICYKLLSASKADGLGACRLCQS